MRKPLRYFLLISVLFLLLLKPITVFTLETYLTSLLETEVKVLSLYLLDLKLQASIKDKNNIVNININSLYPLHADYIYQGNADAFKVYHPLKAKASLQGSLYYKEGFIINAELLALGAKSAVEVKEEKDNWSVKANISHLDLEKLENENSLPVSLSGEVDGDIEFHTKKDSNITITSEGFVIRDEKFNNFKLQLSKVEDMVYAWMVYDAKHLDNKGTWFHYDLNKSHFDAQADLVGTEDGRQILIGLQGDHNKSTITAEADLQFADSNIHLRDLVYDLNSEDVRAEIDIDIKNIQNNLFILELLGMDLKGDIFAKANLAYTDEVLNAVLISQSFGGDLRLDLNDDKLSWSAQELELQKILYLFNVDKKLDSKIDTQGNIHKGVLEAHLNSKLLHLDKTAIKDIDISVKGPLEKFDARLQLQTPYATVLKADVSLEAFSKLKLDAKVTTPYTSDELTVNSAVLYTKELSSLELNVSSEELFFYVPKASLVEGKLDGTYRAVIQPKLSHLKNRLNLDGDFSYDNLFSAKLKNKDFGGELIASLVDDEINLTGTDISTQKLLDELKQPAYVRGNFDLSAKGDLENIKFQVQSKKLTLNEQNTALDENLSAIIDGTINSKELVLNPTIINRHVDTSGGNISFQIAEKKLQVDLPLRLKKEKQNLDLILVSKADLQKDIQTDISLRHKNDRFSLKNMSYKNEKLQTDIALDIKDLSIYNGISGQEFYGPLQISGKAKYKQTADIFLESPTLGGETELTLKDKKLNITFKHLLVVNVGRLLKGKGAETQGLLDGEIKYNLVNKSGRTKLRGSDIEVSGIDIDKSLKELQDMLGLNVFAMGNNLILKRGSSNDDINLRTKVKHIEFDVDINPELIISRDVAMATDNYRFAINTTLQHDGEIKNFEVAILDHQGCAVLTQQLRGNILSPEIVNSTGTAVVLIGSAPQNILKTGGKILDAGASLIDSSVNLLWQKALRQDSEVTLINDTMTKGFNVLSSGKDMVVSGKCKVFYNGAVQHPE